MKRRTFLRNILIPIGGALIGTTSYAYQSSIIDISRERLILPGLKQRLRIVVAADLHMPSFYTSNLELIGLINTELPDIFILAGDTIDKRGNEGLVTIFNNVNAGFAKIATLGNWEYFGDLDLVRLKTEFNNAGVSLLVNDSIEVQGLIVIGLDDLILGAPDYDMLSHSSSSKYPVLVISHCPAIFDFITSFSYSPMIVLSGHTHGGQIAPFGFALHTPEGSGSYIQGWYHKGNHSMYVNRGIGTSPGVPLRIGARPELLVLDLVGNGA